MRVAGAPNESFSEETSTAEIEMAELTFKPRARLMLLLGDQLIRDAGIAVFELVKNAYDADATKCSITLEKIGATSEQARIIVEDNGTGMDLATVKEVWLSPGTRNRLTQREELLKETAKPARSKRGRLPLGEKGVGRFAVHKLGNQVKMITRVADADEVLVVIDWTKFDNDSPLTKVSVSVEERTPQHFVGRRTGTRIEISGLRELPWTRRRVRDLHRAITSICSPVSGPDGFSATLKLNPDPGEWLEGLLTAEQAMQLSLFRFCGRIENGQLTYDYEFKPWPGMKGINPRKISQKVIPIDAATEEQKKKAASADEENTRDLASHQIGPIDIDFHIFDRERDVLQFVPGNMDLLKDFLDQNGGVRVYRDGVRVYDFGEPGNDWLDLGGRRINVPARRIGNNQVIGTIRLKLAKSRDLVEKTNREGFVENPAYRAFRAVVKFAIAQAEAERNIDKQRIRKATAKPKQKEPVLGEVAALREEITKLDLKKEQEKTLRHHLDRIEIQFREVLDRLLTAAGAGLNLAVVLHEVEKGIKSLHAAIKNGEPANIILDRAKQLAEIIDGLTWLTRQSGVIDVVADTLIRHCLFAWSYRFINHRIDVTNGLDHGNPNFTVRGSRRLLMTALMNLIDNAIYWAGVKRVSNRKIFVGTTMELTGNPAFVVADNGPGLQDAPEYLTMPFFTRKPDGMGLGLHIADEIMKIHEGRLAFPEQGDIALPKEFNGAVVLLQFGETKQ